MRSERLSRIAFSGHEGILRTADTGTEAIASGYRAGQIGKPCRYDFSAGKRSAVNDQVQPCKQDQSGHNEEEPVRKVSAAFVENDDTYAYYDNDNEKCLSDIFKESVQYCCQNAVFAEKTAFFPDRADKNVDAEKYQNGNDRSFCSQKAPNGIEKKGSQTDRGQADGQFSEHSDALMIIVLQKYRKNNFSKTFQRNNKKHFQDFRIDGELGLQRWKFGVEIQRESRKLFCERRY